MRGRKLSPAGIRRRPWSIRPDRATEEAARADLARMRGLDPKATMADVVRAWSRAADRQRFVEERTSLALEAQGLRKELERVLAQLQGLETIVGRFRALEGRLAGTTKQPEPLRIALRGVAMPANANLRLELEALAAQEAAAYGLDYDVDREVTVRPHIESWGALLVLARQTVST